MASYLSRKSNTFGSINVVIVASLLYFSLLKKYMMYVNFVNVVVGAVIPGVTAPACSSHSLSHVPGSS